MRKILFLAFVLVTLPLYGVEEMKFITHLGRYTDNFPGYAVAGTVEEIDPTPRSGASGLPAMSVASVTFGELRDSHANFESNQGFITLLGKKSPSIEFFRLNNWTRFWSTENGEFGVNTIKLYRGGILTGGTLYAKNITFAPFNNVGGSTTEMINYQQNNVYTWGNKLIVKGTLSMQKACNVGQCIFSARGLNTNKLTYGPEGHQSVFEGSGGSTGEAKWLQTAPSLWYLVR